MNQCNVSLCIGHALLAVDEDVGVGIVDETSSPRKTICKHSSIEQHHLLHTVIPSHLVPLC